MGKILTLSLFLTALFVLTACTPSAQDNDFIKLGIIAPMTGANAWVAEEMVPAIELSVKQINDQGGINGKELKIIIEDADGAAKASSAATKLIQENKVHALYTITTPVVAVASAIAEQEKKVLFAFTVVNTFAKKNTYVFSDLRDVASECAELSKTALARGDTKLAFFGNDADFSVECYASMQENFIPKGKIVVTETKNSNDPDAKTQLLKIKAADPDAMVLICWPPDCNLIYKQMIELNILPKLYLPIVLPLSGNKISLANIDTKIVFKDAIGTDQGLNIDNPTPAFAQFIKDYTQFKGKDPTLASDGAVAADNIQMIANAMRKCPDLQSDCMRDRLAETDYEGYAGRVQYNGKHTAARSIRLIAFQDGRWITFNP